MVEDEIVSLRLRGVGCCVLTTQLTRRKGQRSREPAGGVGDESFPLRPLGLGLGLRQGCRLQGLMLSFFGGFFPEKNSFGSGEILDILRPC